ncbi:MAG: ATP-binding protein [Verrucomicrobiota bacterium]|jgi:C4-dicarboxylate-specific signal transduction histidine kinase
MNNTIQHKRATQHSVSKRLGCAFCLLIGLLVGVAWLALNRMEQIDKSVEDLAGLRWAKVKLSRQALACSAANSRITLQAFLMTDPQRIEPLLTERERNSETISKLVKKIQRSVQSPEEERLLAAVSEARQPYIESYLKALKLQLQDKRNEEARLVMLESTIPLQIKYHDSWQRFVEYQGLQLDTVARATQSHYASIRRWMLGLSLLAVVGASTIAVFVTRAMAHETFDRQLAEQSLQKAHDDLEVRVAERTRELEQKIVEHQQAEEALRVTKQSLQKAHDDLEIRVVERTRELREQVAAREKAHAELAAAQESLIKASREAGVAEVATGVLHNIGNVLNSVNVSNNIIQEKLRGSKVVTLGKVRDLLQEHEADLASFLTTDPKGKLVPGFIIKLADNLDQELSLLQEEHKQLTSNVEHIKEIVAMQQTYARISGSREKLAVASLVEDALQINLDSFKRRGIEVIRDYTDVPPVTVDKHKVMQILVNLITNAKHAMDASEGPDRRLTLKVGRNGNNCLKVAVSDTGIGIPPENLARLFSYGFTTRKAGHGFGLHSGAITAREIGGRLTAHSDGAGKGATFVLEIPMDTEEAAAPVEASSEREIALPVG